MTAGTGPLVSWGAYAPRRVHADWHAARPPQQVVGPFRALDHAFEVALDVDATAEGLARGLADLRVPDHDRPATRYRVLHRGTGRTPWALYADDERLSLSATAARAVSVLLWAVNRGATASVADRLPVLHAGGVERDGRSVLLAAPMESGKTTLTAGLVLAGWRYLTDEAVALDGRRALPFWKPLSVDRGSWTVLPDLPRVAGLLDEQWQVPVGATRPGALSPGGDVAAVVLPRYVPGADVAVERVPPAEALVELLGSCFTFGEHAPRDLAALAGLLREAPAYRLTGSRLAELVDAVDRLAPR